MDVGVVVLVVARDGVDHRARLLRSGGVVEIDQLLAVDLLVEDGKVARESASTSSAVHANGGLRLADDMLFAARGHPTSSQFFPCLFIVCRMRRRGWRCCASSRTDALANQPLGKLARGRLFLHAVEALAGKGVAAASCAPSARRCRASAGKTALLFDLADGCAVRALHVVGVDFQLRLGVDAAHRRRAAGCDWSAWRRFSARPCAPRCGRERRRALAVENAVVKLAAARSAAAHAPPACSCRDAACPSPTNRPLIRHSAPSPASTGCTLLRTSPPPSRMECEATLALRACCNAQRRDVEGVRCLALDQVVRNHGAPARQPFRGGVGECHPAAERNVIFDHRHLACRSPQR